jgi:hydrogenase maturation factor
MLIVVSKENSSLLLQELKNNGIDAFDIGKFTESKERLLIKNGKSLKINSPESDELYKIIY